MKMKELNGAKGLRATVFILLIFLICVSGKNDGMSNGRGANGNGNGGKGNGGKGPGGKGGKGNGNGNGGGKGNGGYGGKGNDNGSHGGNGNGNYRGLKPLYYQDKCGTVDVEALVWNIVNRYMDRDPTFAPSLLRLQFHDCFLRGCDASVLLKSTATNTAEIEANGNRNLRGLEIIDDAKAALEAGCPGIVSCADILALATKDAVGIIGGPTWDVRTGRRDGLISNKTEVSSNIPSPFAHFSQLRDIFSSKGFSVQELVILSGGHTIGRGHCGAFSSRLYNSTGKGDTDPSLDPVYAEKLKSICSPSDRKTSVPMDPDTPLVFDENYFNILKKNKGLFESDAALLINRQARSVVEKMSKEKNFPEHFAKAMVRMVELDVLTGNDGEIRKKCAFVNGK